ncbi:NAD(P)-dependent dehydrogenase (short-subunit alcohol dehydrogenase family) [Amycolatopsis bartoniae]|uniref:Putative oxidoreductase n=1 Tax=Amycolatopsis bartoniae TaxID=941986 RepID=A0A8H9M8Q8_9PSEU|nr:SDR family oxidoreductase [Amycolatopsis bartoniae]MBB2939751.1 NAD(P)-dependent dehydrogenase (short-subunit alcohol dehydrogenase family) [Amycolatopsis bartoniae]GHF36068.1 putative oxidoreductase [Amycolatopsis bartoniae]
MSRRLDDQVVLITGSTHGIGRRMAELFAHEGARVVVTGRSRDAGAELERTITEAGGQALYVPMDITVEEDVRGAVRAGVERFGKLTALVNNAAWVQGRWKVDGPVTEIALADWEQIFRVNTTGTFLASKYALPEIVRSGGGSVVHIASTAAMQGRAGLDAYTASKGAMVSLTRSMAAYYSRYSVRVNCLVSGFVDTGEPAIRAMLDDPQFGPMIRKYYQGRVGTPSDIAYTAAHLVSDQAGFITGAIVPVDGGATGLSHMDRQVADMPGFPSGAEVDTDAADRLSTAGAEVNPS